MSYGHIDVVNRALKIFDNVTIAVSTHKGKKPLFDERERVSLIKEIFINNKKVKVLQIQGLLSDFINEVGSKVIIRGVRNLSDIEKEMQMAKFNRAMNSTIETILIVANEKYDYISSSLIKEIARINIIKIRKLTVKIFWQAIEKKLKCSKG